MLLELVGLDDERTPSGKRSSLDGIAVRLAKLCTCVGTTNHQPSMWLTGSAPSAVSHAQGCLSMVHAAESLRFALQCTPKVGL